MKTSAGLLLYRKRPEGIEFFLVHPGGPFWKNKDAGSWSIPKGEIEEQEDPLQAAIREFKEETGISPAGDFLSLTPVKQKSGKRVLAWALLMDLDESSIQSNEAELEWPKGSGKIWRFPEVDRAAWFNLETARTKILEAQMPLLEELHVILKE